MEHEGRDIQGNEQREQRDITPDEQRPSAPTAFFKLPERENR